MTVVPTRDRVPQFTPGGPLARPLPLAAPTAGGLTPADILRIVRKRKWLIILSTLIIVALVAIVTTVWRATWPFYKAEALLGVEVPREVALTVAPTMVPKDVMEREKLSHARLVLSTPVLLKAMEKDKVRRTAWFARQDDPVRQLAKDLKVSSVAEAYFVRISLTGTDRADLPEIVNAVLEAYVDYNRESMQTGRTREADRLDAEKRRLEAEKAAMLDQVAAAKREFPSLQSQYNVHDIKLQDLTRQLLNMELLLSQARVDRAVIRAQEQAGTLATAPDVQRAMDMDGNLRTLEATLSQLVPQRSRLGEKLGPQHRQVQDLDASIEVTRKELETKRAEVIRTAILGITTAADANLENISEQVKEVRERYNEGISTLRDLQANLSTVQALETRVDVLKDNVARIDGRLLDVRLLSQGGERPVWAASPADLPKEISFPRWEIMIPLGSILGLLIGMGLAFLLEMMDTSIKSPSDVSRRVDLPLLGMVPHADDLDDDIEDLRLAFRTHPGSLVGEAFRQIHTCLLFSGPANQRRTVLVTSSSSLDGRTTVATNLAAAAARTGRRVLVVDTNFRQPMIAQLFGQGDQLGLSSALVGQANWRDLVMEVEVNFHVLCAGTLPPNPAELLGSDPMRAIIAEMVQEYDQVLFDSAPCLVVTHAIGLSTMVDGVVLVVRAGANTLGIVQRTRDMLVRVGAHVLGVVLNGVQATPGGYLRKNYAAFYEYHHRERQLPAPAAKAAK
ncbi:MAG: polysaccharide biosynthesis tyrosine autokinase [Phycisphaerae bacterium]|nr:polysaccharide biosynthesis tyrosine autokinase [Phycisphaerae bacterium]